uniref:Ig-like domain-containing protein n=1 Tax=Esox lucius TaxID=8010 RepID=A0A3P8ZU49_ESOLU
SERWFNQPLPHTKCRGEDSVTQPTGDVITTEGGPVTLGCTFNSQVANSYLFWYKQGANDHPKYMLMRFKVGTTPGDNAADFKDRFHADVDANANSVPLRIQDLQLTDSAVYYCALKPTVTTGYTTPLHKHSVGDNDKTPVTIKPQFYFISYVRGLDQRTVVTPVLCSHHILGTLVFLSLPLCAVSKICYYTTCNNSGPHRQLQKD